MSAAIHQGLGNYSITKRLASDVMNLSDKFQFSYWKSWARILYGWSLAKEGNNQQGLLEIELGLDEYRTTEAELFRPYTLALMAEIYLDANKPERTLDCIAEGLVSSSASEVHFFDAELHRIRGLALIQLNSDPDEITSSFDQAVKISESQKSYTILLRSLTSRTCYLTGERRSESLKRLIEASELFTEGFDTPDLVKANSVINNYNVGI